MSVVDPGSEDSDSVEEDPVTLFTRASRDLAKYGTPMDARKSIEGRPSIESLAPSPQFMAEREQVLHSLEHTRPSVDMHPSVEHEQPASSSCCGRAAGLCQGRAWFAEQALGIIDKLADGAHVGVNIVAPTAGGFEPWFRFNAERMMTPASNTKLLTIGTAFLNLDHDAVAVTVASTSSNRLCVACAADPSLTEQTMAQLAQGLVRAGPPAVELVVQPRYPGPEFPPSWMAEDITADYGAHPAQGCLVDEGAFSLTVAPNPQGQGLPPVVRFASAAVAASIKLLNVAVTSPPSGDQPPLSVGYHMGVEALVVAGSIAPGAPAQSFTVAAPLATAFYAQLMRYYLRQSGALADNATVSVGRCPPPDSSTGATAASAPFLQLWNFTLQNSDNFYAETFARTLGYPDGSAQFGAAAIDLGIANITATLRQHGVGGNWQLWDGSGVSRKNLIQPQTLTDLLLVMYARPDYASSWLPLLPVGCVSGTLSSRFCTPQTQGNVHAKTGTVSGVSALSGYAYTPYSSDPFVFSIIVNNAYYSASQQRQLIDSIVDLLFQVQHC